MKPWSVVLSCVLTACVPAWPYSSMASHTVKLDDQHEQDVVWVQHVDGKLYRCHRASEGPTCQAVQKL